MRKGAPQKVAKSAKQCFLLVIYVPLANGLLKQLPLNLDGKWGQLPSNKVCIKFLPQQM